MDGYLYWWIYVDMDRWMSTSIPMQIQIRMHMYIFMCYIYMFSMYICRYIDI